MIPDKIYIAAQTFPNEIDWDGSPINTKKVEDTDVQYIRKDTLLEFINEELQESADRLDFRTNKAYAELLDKINSL